MEELDLVATLGAGIFAVGNAVAQYLKRRAFAPFTRVPHYSCMAARARAAGIDGHTDCFKEFRKSLSLGRILATAEDVLNASAVPANFRNETLARLAKSQLSESRQQLIFNYKLIFERYSRQTGTSSLKTGPDKMLVFWQNLSEGRLCR
jgi:hypothetical protein